MTFLIHTYPWSKVKTVIGFTVSTEKEPLSVRMSKNTFPGEINLFKNKTSPKKKGFIFHFVCCNSLPLHLP